MIKILSAKNALKELESGQLRDFALISIRDNKESAVYGKIDSMEHRCRAMHVVYMSDLHMGYTPMRGEIMPSVELVRGALEFAAGHADVAVHCTAGVSRSSALAYILEVQRTGDSDEAVKILNPMVHYPNMLIVEIGEHILDVDCVISIIEFNRMAEEAMFDTDNE